MIDKELSDRLNRLQKDINRIGKSVPKKHKTRYIPCQYCGRDVAVRSGMKLPPTCGSCWEKEYIDIYNTQRPLVRTNIRAINRTIKDYEGS